MVNLIVLKEPRAEIIAFGLKNQALLLFMLVFPILLCHIIFKLLILLEVSTVASLINQ
jgi:hypothetical protein